MRRLTMPRLSGLSEGAPAASSPSANPNLLLWSEEFQQAVWTKSVVTVTADAAASPNPPGDGSATADLCQWGGATRALRQTTTVSATTVTPSSLVINPSAEALTWTRFTASADVDGATYIASIYLLYLAGTGKLTFSLSAFGGFVRANFVADASVDCYAWGAKLETPTLTAYVKREGT